MYKNCPKKVIIAFAVLFVVIIFGCIAYGCFNLPGREKPANNRTVLKSDNKSDEQTIKNLFAQKYNRDSSEITVTIGQKTESHMRGGVLFGQGEAGEGGIFLAVKENGEWKIVHDGNGAISCEEMQKYDFPQDMIFDCADAEQNSTRQILTEKGEQFAVGLESNASTGHSWRADFDEEYLRLISDAYEEPADKQMVGASGWQRFAFEALQAGETQIDFSYSRSWEENVTPVDQKTYIITIE